MKKIYQSLNEYQHFTNTWLKVFDCFPIDVKKYLYRMKKV